MRLVSCSFAALAALASFGSARAEAPVVTKKACTPVPVQPVEGDLSSKINALDLLSSLTQLLSPLGKQVLESNRSVSVGINNTAPEAVRAQALVDAQITDANANVLADGLGATMAEIYRDQAFFTSKDDGQNVSVGRIGPYLAKLIKAANHVSGTDSGEGKFAFADGSEPFLGKKYLLPPGGAFDVLGQSYDLAAGKDGADCHGNSRPFQTAPLDGAKPPAIHSFVSTDFFGVAMSSRVVLSGATQADKDAGRYAFPLTESPSYPSGHTTFGYTEALLLALLVPERYRALAYRGSEYGNSRIVLGAHYPVDVIGGRTLATYDLAQDLAGTKGYADVKGKSFRSAVTAAAGELRAYLQGHGCPIIAACAKDPIVRAANAGIWRDGTFATASPGDAYAFRLNYGLAPMAVTDAPPEPVPPEAGLLLETRFPYLTADQRREVLRTTEGPSGHFLDVSPVDGAPLSAVSSGAGAQAGVYSRLNLFAAAGGPGRLDGDFVVNQDSGLLTDPTLRPFADLAKDDTWSNDIKGPGGLTKRGSGTLRLEGHSTYEGPTRVEGGVLDVTGSVRSPIDVGGSSTLAGTGVTGSVKVATAGAFAPQGLKIEGDLVVSAGGNFIAKPSGSGATAVVTGGAEIDGAILVIDASGVTKPSPFTVLGAAGGLHGAFAKVELQGSDRVAKLSYRPKSVTVAFEQKAADASSSSKP